jgi:hypothetical protein
MKSSFSTEETSWLLFLLPTPIVGVWRRGRR